MFTGMPEMASYPKELLAYEFEDNDQESYFMYHTNVTTTTAMFHMEVSGQVDAVTWIESVQDWAPFLSMPKAQCSVYFVCGSFAICTENAFTFCSCIRGFNKQYEGNWLYGNPRGGCRRNARLECVANRSRNAEVDDFYALAVTKMPDKAWSAVAATADGCKQACLSNCSCAAYFYGDNCSLWYGDLINLVAPIDGSTGHTIYIRLAASEFLSVSTKTGNALPVWALTCGTVLVILGVLLFLTKWFHGKTKIIEGSLVVFRFRYLRSVTKKNSRRGWAKDLLVQCTRECYLTGR